MTYTVTNPSKAAGPRGFRAAAVGKVMLDPGQSITVAELSDEEKKAGEVVGLTFKSGKASAEKKEDGPKALSSMNRAELDAEVAAIQKEDAEFKLPEDATTNAKIAEAIEGYRASKTDQ